MAVKAELKPLEAYDVLREMHKLLKRAVAPDFKAYATGKWHPMDRRILRAFDDVSTALYVAEAQMVELEAGE